MDYDQRIQRLRTLVSDALSDLDRFQVGSKPLRRVGMKIVLHQTTRYADNATFDLVRKRIADLADELNILENETDEAIEEAGEAVEDDRAFDREPEE